MHLYSVCHVNKTNVNSPNPFLLTVRGRPQKCNIRALNKCFFRILHMFTHYLEPKEQHCKVVDISGVVLASTISVVLC